MNYLSMLNENEIRYVCSVIPLSDTVWYFKRYPKDFSKILPGYRPKSLKSQEQVGALLFRSRNQYFISSFLEKYINKWLDEINEAIEHEINKGTSMELAFLKTLPFCYFVDDIAIYFKLLGKEYTQEYILLLSESIRIIKNADKERGIDKSKLETKVKDIIDLELQIERYSKELIKVRKKLAEMSNEIITLKQTNDMFEKSKVKITQLEQEIENLKKVNQEYKDCISQLRTELSFAKDEQKQFKGKPMSDLDSKRAIEQYVKEVARIPMRPKDLEEFKDYLGYNFESIGVPINADYFPLLKNHLSEILFQGKPIIVSRSTGFALMGCISNTLIKSSMVPVLKFDSRVIEEDINNFLSQDKRLLCLDNFIGNYNETTLITICDNHKDKIIFFTVLFEHTLAYVPDELMRYCHYINLNRIEGFIGDKEYTEDPSSMDEEETIPITHVPDARWSFFLRETLEELGVRSVLSEYKSTQVFNETILCCILAFDVLPYCKDVLKIAPFSISERLVKYAGNNGRCHYKALFGRWFA